MSAGKRSPAADIIRIFAFFCVVSVHFFLNSKFYDYPTEGKTMLVMTICRSFFMICVPLFLLLSGYLLWKKPLSLDYYKKISRIIITYVLASIICLFYMKFTTFQDMTIKDAVLAIFSFMGAPYSWYIEMYLGLFLLIPFLNIIYNNLPSQKWKLILIASFIILTSLHGVVNVYEFSSLEWWAEPSSSSAYTKIMPNWWKTIYPVTYYFIGCYLSDFGLKIKKLSNIIFIGLVTILFGVYTFWRSYKVPFIWGDWCDYPSIFVVALTVLVFVFFVNLKYDKISDKTAVILQKLSGLTLGGYLVSYVFDSYFYEKLIEKVPVMTDRFIYFPVIVPLVFVLSVIASYLINIIQSLIEKMIDLICKSFKKIKR